VTLAQLDFGQTMAAGALQAFLTALFVGIAAGMVVRLYDHRAAKELQKT
jgi:hypothetical protein